ncbi:MAG TPA: BNR repeat-containing protein [Cyclobacteriaceae bacterium]|nr:BNR repeat-containing protein [Cyclobacteriaceae bacterium]
MHSLLLFLCLSGSSFSFGQSYVGEGWAKTSVNAVVFRKNSVVTHKGMQYVSYYDSSGFVMLAKRDLRKDEWHVERTPYRGNVSDAHNSISLMVDGEGYLHLSWDHHSQPLNYCRSVRPGSLTLTQRMAMVGRDEDDVTYPEFHRLPSGDLIFLYRSGMSGRGNLIMNRYDTKLGKWFRVQDVLVDGEGKRNAYWQFCTDALGTLHLSWVWRESPDVSTNHDLCYARSKDNGKTWERSNGEPYQLPITEANAEYAVRIPEASELINQTSMSADEKGNPFIATYWKERNSSAPQYYIVYNLHGRWQRQQVGERHMQFSLSGGGTKKIPISRPQVVVQKISQKIKVVMIFRDSERGNKVSAAIKDDLETGSWYYRDFTDYSVGQWEPSFDTELWKNQKLLQLFVQNVGQGDGEMIEDIKPQPIFIFDIPL